MFSDKSLGISGLLAYLPNNIPRILPRQSSGAKSVVFSACAGMVDTREKEGNKKRTDERRWQGLKDSFSIFHNLPTKVSWVWLGFFYLLWVLEISFLKNNNKPSPQPLHTHPLNLDQAISFENAHGNMVIMQNLGLLQPISYIDLLLLFPLYRRRSWVQRGYVTFPGYTAGSDKAPLGPPLLEALSQERQAYNKMSISQCDEVPGMYQVVGEPAILLRWWVWNRTQERWNLSEALKDE